MQPRTENKKSPRSKDLFSAHVRGARDVLVMKLWCPKQPDLMFRGRNEVLWLRTVTLIRSLSFHLSSATRARYGKRKENGKGGKKPPKHLTQCNISHDGQALSSSRYLPFLGASMLPETRRERTDPAQRHTGQRTLRRTGEKQKGKERRVDVMEE